MDVWAIGIMMFCMIFNKFPFSGSTRDEIKAKITGSPYVLPKIKLITKECQDFLAQCLVKNPEERIQIEKMLSHPWLTISDDDLDEKCDKLTEVILISPTPKQSFKLPKEEKKIEKKRQTAFGGFRYDIKLAHDRRKSVNRVPEISSPITPAYKNQSLIKK
jgi:serine/threonine protein kinase